MEQKVEDVFINLEDEREKEKKENRKKRRGWVVLAIFVAILAAGFLYLNSNSAKVKSIKVIGNTYLSDEYIISMSDISYDSKYIFLLASNKSKEMEKSDLISSAKITLGKNNSVIIEVKENKIVGYKVDNKTMLILESGDVIDFDAKYIKNLALLPLFIDVLDENIANTAQAMGQLSDEVLMHISEVRRLSFTYDYNMVKFVMDDGNYVYSSVAGIPYVNTYLEMVINQKNTKNKCFLIIEEYARAVNTDCKELDSYTIGSSLIEDDDSNVDGNAEGN